MATAASRNVLSGPEATAAITFDKVTVRRRETEVLRDVSLRIPAGKVTAVVGRSGVGKTTLVAALNGLLQPSSGRISVAGVGPLDNPRALLEHRRRSATVFQNYALVDRLTALDNVLLGLAGSRHPLSPWPFTLDQRRVALSMLETVGLAHRALARVDQLSGGERQRVGIARALTRSPTLLLGDEPFTSVDASFVRYLGNEFHRLVERTHLTVVLVLHQLETARALADRVMDSLGDASRSMGRVRPLTPGPGFGV